MNYIAEINAFYRWLGGNPLKSPAIALWHALMSIASDASYGADWQMQITPAISTLQSRTGLGKDSIVKARNQLKQAGRIDWRSRGGSASATYTIIPLVSEMPTQPATQPQPQLPPQLPLQVPPQLPTIYKPDQTKPNTCTGGSAREVSASEFSLTDMQVSDLRRIGESYEADIGAIPSSAMYEFREYYLGQGISADVIIRAIQAAAENNARTWPYIKSILERCIKEKVVTLEDWRQAELRKTTRKAGGGKPSGGQTGGKSFTEIIAERMGT